MPELPANQSADEPPCHLRAHPLSGPRSLSSAINHWESIVSCAVVQDSGENRLVSVAVTTSTPTTRTYSAHRLRRKVVAAERAPGTIRPPKRHLLSAASPISAINPRSLQATIDRTAVAA